MSTDELTDTSSNPTFEKLPPKKIGCLFILPRIGLFISLGIAILTAADMYYSFRFSGYDLLRAVIFAHFFNLIGFLMFIFSVLIESKLPVKSKYWTAAFILAALVLIPYWLFVVGWSGNVNTWIWLRS